MYILSMIQMINFKTISIITKVKSVFLVPGILYLKGYADFHSVSGSHFELDPRTVILNKVKLSNYPIKS
jgi:hypothetical protein